MSIRRYTIAATLLALLSSPFAAAGDPSPAKRADLEKLLDMTGAMKIGQSMAQAMVVQLGKIIKSAHPNIPDKVLNALPEEVNAVISDNMAAMTEIMIHLYDKYYTEDDVKALLAFYSTPIGRKVIATMPDLSQESLQAGMMWGRALGPEIDRRVKARFKKEGYDL